MKKIAKILLCLVLVLCTLACFAACKKKNAATAATEIPTDAAVCYYLAGAKYGDEKVWPLSDLQIYDPQECYIYFDPSGTGLLCIDGWDVTYFEYADGQLWDEMDPDSKTNYIVEGDALTLEQDGYKLVFTKGEIPERFIAQEETEEVPNEGVVEEPAEESGDIVEIPAN